MKILMLGASGRSGRLITRHLATEGHDVIAMGRRSPEAEGVDFVAGDVTEPGALRDVLTYVEAVVSALASSNADPVCSGAAGAVIAASGGRSLRFLTIGGAGVDAEGDRKGLGDRAVGVAMRVVAGRMLADRQREYGLLRASHLDWTMLRPPRLVDGAGTGRWRFTFDRPAAMRITRADLAAAMVEALGRDDLRRSAPFVAEAA